MMFITLIHKNSSANNKKEDKIYNKMLLPWFDLCGTHAEVGANGTSKVTYNLSFQVSRSLALNRGTLYNLVPRDLYYKLIIKIIISCFLRFCEFVGEKQKHGLRSIEMC